MITLTEEEAGRALGVPALAGPVMGISIDSRSLRRGDLFVALRGERFDGHDFVDAAVAAGASGVVVERTAGAAMTTAHAVPVYGVDDTLEALGALAREVRRKSRAIVFAVTGSVGKTSTKDLLSAMVGRVRRVVATNSNQNNEVGVPLTLLRIDDQTDAVVVEMGMRASGEIARLARIAEPDVGVITNIHPVHLELLGTIENIARAKAELLGELAENGVAVVPAEDGALQPFVAASGRRAVTFSAGDLATTADVRVSRRPSERGKSEALVVLWPEGEAVVETAHLAAHVVENVAAAAAACYAAGLPVGECARGIGETRFSPNRGELIELPGVLVVDDTYNANPAAVRAALDGLVRLAAQRGGRPVAVLGDMLELGPESATFHRQVGAYAAELGVRALWGVGRESMETVRGFREGWEARQASVGDFWAGHVVSAEESSPVLRGLGPSDVVLFKASRSIRLEKMVRRLVDERRAGTRETE